MPSSTLEKTLISIACVTTSVLFVGAMVVGVRDLLPGTQPAIADQKQVIADGTPNKTPAPTSDKTSPAPESTAAPEAPEASGLPDSAETAETAPSQEPNTKAVDKASQPAYLQVQSTPAGARVEVGVQYSGWSITPRSGKKTCIAPCVVKLDPADVAVLPNGNSSLIISLEKNGFSSHTDVLDLGKVDRSEALIPGKTYERSITLQSGSRTQASTTSGYSEWNLDTDS